MSNKRIVKNSIYLYIRLIVTMFVGLFTSRFVLGALGASDYGLYNVVGGIVGMMSFVNTMMVTTTYRFIAYEQGKPDGDVNKIFNISLVIHIGAAIIVLILALTLGLFYISRYLVVEPGKLTDAYFVFFFSMSYAIIQIVAIPFNGLLVANEQFAVTVPIEIGTKILVLLVAIIVNNISANHLRVYTVLVTAAHLMNPVSYFLYCFRKYNSTIKWRFQRGWHNYKPMFAFTGWNSLEVAATTGESQGAAMIINNFFGTTLNASFGVARQVNSLVQMFSRSLGQAVVPQITKSYSSGETDRSLDLVILSSKYSFFLMLIPTLPIMLETQFILNVWLKSVPQFTAIFVQGMLLKSLIVTSQSGIGPLIHATGKIKNLKISTSVVSLLSLPLAIVAFKNGMPPYTITYIYVIVAAINFVVTQVVLSATIRFDTKKFLSESILPVVKVCLAILPLFVLQRFMPYGILRFVLSCVLSLIALFLSIYYLGMGQGERERIIRFFREGIGHLKQKRSEEQIT